MGLGDLFKKKQKEVQCYWLRDAKRVISSIGKGDKYYLCEEKQLVSVERFRFLVEDVLHSCSSNLETITQDDTKWYALCQKN